MKNTKRYMVILETWSKKTFSQDKFESDSINDINNHVKLIESCYDFNKYGTDKHGDVLYVGYIVLDFDIEKIIKWSKNGMIYNSKKSDNPLVLKDKFFRGEDEIPKDYEWDIGEYEGWLQFRWGDGKNAIGYVEKKPKNSCLLHNDSSSLTTEELLENKFDNEIENEKISLKSERW